jgi:hypothetical protein
MYLRDVSVYADEAIVERFKGGFVGRFPDEASCVVDHYLTRLPKVDGGKFCKVIYRFSDAMRRPASEGEIEKLIDVLVVPWHFDFSSYLQAERIHKKRMVLEALHEAMFWTASHFGWDKIPFETAYQAVIVAELRFNGVSTKSWRSPSKKWRARVSFEYDIDSVTLYALLFRNRTRDEVSRKVLGTAMPQYGCLRSYLRSGQWTSETVFELTLDLYWKKCLAVDFSEYM